MPTHSVESQARSFEDPTLVRPLEPDAWALPSRRKEAVSDLLG